MLAYFDNIKFDEPTKTRQNVHMMIRNSSGLFASQLDRGKILSEKQLAVLGRFAAKYKEQMQPDNFVALCKLIGVDPEKTGSCNERR